MGAMGMAEGGLGRTLRNLELECPSHGRLEGIVVLSTPRPVMVGAVRTW